MKVKGHPPVRLNIDEWYILYGVIFVSKIKSDTHNKYSANQSANRVDWVNRSAIHSFRKSICKCIILHFDLQLLLTQQIDLHFDLQFDLQVVLSINAFRETKFC